MEWDAFPLVMTQFKAEFRLPPFRSELGAFTLTGATNWTELGWPCMYRSHVYQW